MRTGRREKRQCYSAVILRRICRYGAFSSTDFTRTRASTQQHTNVTPSALKLVQIRLMLSPLKSLHLHYTNTIEPLDYFTMSHGIHNRLTQFVTAATSDVWINKPIILTDQHANIGYSTRRLKKLPWLSESKRPRIAMNDVKNATKTDTVVATGISSVCTLSSRTTRIRGSAAYGKWDC